MNDDEAKQLAEFAAQFGALESQAGQDMYQAMVQRMNYEARDHEVQTQAIANYYRSKSGMFSAITLLVLIGALAGMIGCAVLIHNTWF